MKINPKDCLETMIKNLKLKYEIYVAVSNKTQSPKYQSLLCLQNTHYSINIRVYIFKH